VPICVTGDIGQLNAYSPGNIQNETESALAQSSQAECRSAIRNGCIEGMRESGPCLQRVEFTTCTLSRVGKGVPANFVDLALEVGETFLIGDSESLACGGMKVAWLSHLDC